MSGREALLLVLTVMRLGLAAGLCIAVWRQAPPYISVAWLAANAVADLGDGVIARWLGVDTTLRRITDVTVDRITIHAAAAVLMWTTPETAWLLLPIIVRDIVLILRNVWLFVYKRVIITPGNIHRTGTFLYVVLYATVLFTTDEPAVWVSVIVSMVVWFLLLDYLRAGALVSAHPRGEGLGRYQACGLRCLRGIAPPLKSRTGA